VSFIKRVWNSDAAEWDEVRVDAVERKEHRKLLKQARLEAADAALERAAQLFDGPEYTKCVSRKIRALKSNAKPSGN
jgi:hypothetical protein